MFNVLGYIALLIEGTIEAGSVGVAAHRDRATLRVVVVRVVGGKRVTFIINRKLFARSVVGVFFIAIFVAPHESRVIAVTRGVRSGTTLRLIKRPVTHKTVGDTVARKKALEFSRC